MIPRGSGGDNSLLSVNTNEMDVSRVDPEEVLVDFKTIEAGDISVDINPSTLSESAQDTVLVSVSSQFPSLPSQSLRVVSSISY